jgi:hypothetical protein
MQEYCIIQYLTIGAVVLGKLQQRWRMGNGPVASVEQPAPELFLAWGLNGLKVKDGQQLLQSRVSRNLEDD